MRASTAEAIDNMAAVWAAVEALQQAPQPVRPPNSFTVAEYCHRYRVPDRTARDRLDRMVAGGILSRVLVALPSSAGRITPTWCYAVND